jgi:hypothetical protein
MDGRCQHVKADGTPCRATVQSGSTHCFFHDPSRAEEQREARRAGGRTRNRRPDPGPVEDLPLATVQDVVALLSKTINDVRSGRMEAKTGNAVAVLVGQLLAALRGGTLEDRIRRLEEDLADREHAGQS